MTANLVVQVCLEPKLVAVALERESSDRRSRGPGGGFTVSLPPSRRPGRGAPVREAGRPRSSVRPTAR